MIKVNVHPIHLFLVKKRTTFTWLIPLGLVAATWFWGHRNYTIYAIGLAFSLLGELVRVWAAGTIHKDDTIAEVGPYGLVRNPLYLGSLLIAIGVSVMSGLGPIAWAAILLLFLLFHMAAILYEEQFLKQKFGAPYELYLTRVPRLIPMPGKSSVGGAAPQFSWKQVKFNREPTTASITLVTALLFGLLQVFCGK
jgi:protein-S-isoprenylcysteine O-methyltransferase Ste14